MIPPDFIQTLLSRVDIVDVVERYLTLKKAGTNYAACCPFHQEKTPSFTVSPSKQFYHCFGCGAHGSAIGFLMEHAGLDFVEAVKQLAESVGLEVPRVSAAPTRAPGEAQPLELTQVLRAALDYYRAQLKGSQRAIAYLKQRGLSGQICARFGIGYAPDGWQNLAAVFPDYKSRLLKDAGLVVDSDAGRRYDRFRDRIMFPIVNSKGEVIGFGGRVLASAASVSGDGVESADDSAGPKYLNSPETPVFEKGRELYGLPQARQAIRERDRVIVVEGYMDVVALAQHGVENAVATLGTATTPFHVQKLFRHSPNVVFCFDGDAAGQRAAWRALETSLGQLQDGKSVSFLFLPTGEDPDSFVRAQGRAAFESAVDKAVPLSAFLLQGLTQGLNLATQEGRAKLLQSAKPLVDQVQAPMMGFMLRKRLAELAGLGVAELERVFGKAPVARASAPARVSRSAPSLATRVLVLALARPETIRRLAPALLAEPDAETNLLARVLEIIRQEPNLGGFLERFRTDPEWEEMQARSREAARLAREFSEEQIDQELADGLKALQIAQRQRQIEAYTEKAKAQGLSAEEKRVYRELLAARH